MNDEAENPEIGKLVRLPQSGALIQQTVAELEQAFALAVRQRELLSDYIKKQLKPGKHFYEIKGQENRKPSLAKEGAEIILLPHNYTPDYELIGGPTEPPEGDAPYQITMKCTLRRKGEPNSFVGSGIGSAGSHKGTWRDSDFIYVSRQRDRYLCHNATLKMAQKSAMVSATINATAASEFFTQDLDEAAEQPTPPKPAAKPASKPAARVATEKFRLRFLTVIGEKFEPQIIGAWAIAGGYLTEGMNLEEWPLEKVPTTKEALDKMLADCSVFAKVPMKPKSTPQSELEAKIIGAGFTFDQFIEWAVGTGNLEDATKYPSFADLPSKKVLHWLTNLNSILSALES